MSAPAIPLDKLAATAQYAALFIQVVEHLWPGTKIFDLSPQKERIAHNEMKLLLMSARWHAESKCLADVFWTPAPHGIDPAESPGGSAAQAPARGNGGYA